MEVLQRSVLKAVVKLLYLLQTASVKIKSWCVTVNEWCSSQSLATYDFLAPVALLHNLDSASNSTLDELLTGPPVFTLC